MESGRNICSDRFCRFSDNRGSYDLPEGGTSVGSCEKFAQEEEWKMKRFMVFVLMVLTAFGCVSCAGNQQAAETQNAETTPWTIEGAFCDDAENPRYLLDIAL